MNEHTDLNVSYMPYRYNDKDRLKGEHNESSFNLFLFLLHQFNYKLA